MRGVFATLGLTLLIACSASTEVDEPGVAVQAEDDLAPSAKSVRDSSVTMTCEQATTGCTPVGYRTAYCTMANLKPNSYVTTCVKARCPAVYGYDNGRGESCFTPQKVALDGTAIAFLPLLPDAAYSLTTYTSKNGVPGEVLASASVSLVSSVGVNTQCGGVPSGSCL